MNRGAFVFNNAVLTADEVAGMARLASELSETRRKVHAEGEYSHYQWFEVDLSPDIGPCRRILEELDVDEPEVLGLYYLEPGARIHPHRDLTGASHNDRIRFHVPIVTNPGVDFRVSGERVTMNPGELWCLDTSYKHSVANRGDRSRVHLIIECAISPKIRRQLPSDLPAKAHGVFYAGVLGVKFMEALLRNSVTNPAHFRAQMGMVRRFIGWRILKNRRPG